MTRLARFVVPGSPHHVLQRGVHDEVLFASEDDYKLYGSLLAEGCRRRGLGLLPDADLYPAAPAAPAR